MNRAQAHLPRAHRARLLLSDDIDKVSGVARKQTLGAPGPLTLSHPLPGGDAVGDDAGAAVARQVPLGPGRVAHRARRRLRLRLGPVRLANDGLDLALVRLRDLFPVLGLHQPRGKLQSASLQTRALALDDGGGEDGDHVRGEFVDAARHPAQQPRRAGVILPLNPELHQRVGVQEHERLGEIRRRSPPLARQLAMRVEELPVRHLVVAHLLLLPRDEHGCLRRRVVVPERDVQPEQVIRIFGHAVGFAHEVVDERRRQRIVPRLADDVNRLVQDARLVRVSKVRPDGGGAFAARGVHVTRARRVVFLLEELREPSGDEHGCLRRRVVVPERDVQPEQVIRIFGHAVGFAHEVVDERRRQRIVPRLADDVNRLVQDARLVRVSKVRPDGGGAFAARGVHVTRARRVVFLLEELREPSVVLGRAAVAQRGDEQVHLAAFTRELKRLVHLPPDEQKFNRVGGGALPFAPLGAHERAVHAPRHANQRERLVRVPQVLQLQTHDAVEVPGEFVGIRRLLQLPLVLLRPGVPRVQLGRGHLLHDGPGEMKELGVDVYRRSFLVFAAPFVQLSRVLVLLQLLADIRALAAELLRAAVQRDDLTPADVAQVQQAPGDPRVAPRQLLIALVRVLDRALVQFQRSVVLTPRLEDSGVLPAYVVQLARIRRLGELQGLLPVLQIFAHLERRLRPAASKEQLLRHVVTIVPFEEDQDVPRKHVLILYVLQSLQRHHH
mmetsp:Transcript_9474/g.41475  ORF Transcript_9474/g.41475 Transcript_9474/m.41475 type:complete len:726 (+) Transcript_9474:170-2347(+)